ncbi:hypothetical protein COCNU_06G016190 [Cocos nucifera]|uniref:Uncharacterized protein n=1 Tax=Cocos nucifera TaxID=13894 RepID=A0A8K0ID14_COCNU|nr:hypothetical protein COCNU_06G016190 [Cocos nucifera]
MFDLPFLLGCWYSSGAYYGPEGSFEEPMGRDSLQELWQKYTVDIAFCVHVHNYERTRPIYQNTFVCNNRTIIMVHLQKPPM